MNKLLRPLALLIIVGIVLASCNLNRSAQNSNLIAPTAPLSQLVTIQLSVQTDPSIPLNAVGQMIKYSYSIKNAGSTGVPAGLPTDVVVTGATATCPSVTTVGNLNTTLDPNETLVCSSTYPITQADLDKGSVTTVITASVGGISSQPVTATVLMAPLLELRLTKTANPVTFDHLGQQVTYAYVITNSGKTSLGPTQFTVSDTGIGNGAPTNCGGANLTLVPNATVICSIIYTITQADMDAGSVSTIATASGGGAGPSQPASASVTKSVVSAPPLPTNPSNLTPGSTIQHQVMAGEWLWQIARCYGADPQKTIQANPLLANPSLITPNSMLTVPNVGSVGKIYGPPCVVTYTVQSGDTWNSIALKYNADPTVLQMVNSSLAVGTVIKVPINSAGAAVPPTPTSTPQAAGNCIDLTRTLKLSGAPSGLTHFNICGVADSAGRMKIATIQITQRVEDVGAGGLSQSILMPATVVTSTPLNDANSLIVGDMNYDGNDDFRIVKNVPAGPNIPFVYYLYDPLIHQFVYNQAYEAITSPEFPGNAQIRSQWRESAAKWGVDTYTIANNTPRLIQRETWEALNATQATHTITVFNADGTSQVTVNETVPLPIQ